MRVLRVYHGGRDAAHRERDRALAAAGVTLTLVVPSTWPGPDDGFGDEPFEVLERPVVRAGDVNRHRYRSGLADLIAAVRPDVLDVHEEPFSSVTHQVLGDAPADLPVVGYTAQNLDKRFPPPFDRWERAALIRLDGLYPCSRRAASVAAGKGYAGPVSVLPLAPSDLVTPGDQVLPADPVRLLLVGRLVPEKGVLDAVRVAAEVPRCVLTLVGDGPEAGPALALARDLAAEVTHVPWLPLPELAALYRSAHVLLAPSRTTPTWAEQFGRMVAEAQAAGAVAVGYTSGALPEVCRGPLVPEGDVGALTAAVAGLVADPARWAALRERGRETAPTWKDVAAGQIELYERARIPRVRVRARPDRGAAVRAFGAPAAEGRRFALPLLRDDTGLTRAAGRIADAVTRRSPTRPRPPVRVLFLDHVARLSGGEIALARLIESVPEIEAHVLLAEDGPLVAALERAGARVEVVPLDAGVRDTHRAAAVGARSAALSAAYAARIARRIRSVAPDIVHTNSLKSGFYGGVAARLAGVPQVWHLRDRLADDYLPPDGRVDPAALRALPAAVLSNSAETRRCGGVGGAVLPDPYRPRRPPRRAEPPDVLTVLTVGRLSPWKGHDVVLQAVARHADVRLRVAGASLFGEADELPRLTAHADRLGVRDRVEFLGFVADVEAELAAADVLVHASTIPEPFGQVVVEALAAGTPVIATDAGGPREILTDGVDGLLVAPGDVDALAMALGRLRDPERRAALSAAGLRRAADFTPEVIGPRLLHLYDRVLGTGKDW